MCEFNFLFFLLLPKEDLSVFFLFFCVRDVYKRESSLLCMGWSSVNWIVRSQESVLLLRCARASRKESSLIYF